MKKYIARILVFLFFVGFGFEGFSQSVEDLRKNRESLLQEISTTSRLIQEKEENRTDNLRELNLIEREVSTRMKLIDNFHNEINQLDYQIEVNQMLVNDLESDIKDLKEDYARLLRDSYRQKGELNELMFIFSSKDFSEAYLRFRLLKEYGRYRQRQGEVLIQSQKKVHNLLREIQHQRSEKESMLNNIESEVQRLKNNRIRKNKLVQRLQTEQQWLQKSLKEKELAAAELEKRIMDIIEAERNKTIDTGESSDFSERMGNLIWPVEKGIIVNEFGEHRHPVLSNVTIKNNGIDIQISGRSDVFCVHPGVVSTVIAIPGLNKAVIVRHGKFLTVYGNLVDVFVSKNDIVSAGMTIGKVYLDDSEMKEVLHFEIWEENKKLDPEQWLLR